jgi:alpha-galactosidase
VASPLMAGNDLRTMTDATKAILMNKEVIAIDQDPLGKQAIPKKDGDTETWLKPLANGELAVAIVNHALVPVQTTVRASELPVHGGVKRARNLWAHREVKFSKHGEYSETIPSHGVLLLKVSAK